MKHTPQGALFTELVLEVFRLSGLLVSVGDEMSGAFGLSSARWKVLGAVALAGTRPTVPQVARRMGQTRQAVQRVVNGLCDDGLLACVDNPDHKRAKRLELTARGEVVYRALEGRQVPWANALAGGLDAADLARSLETLRGIVAALDAGR